MQRIDFFFDILFLQNMELRGVCVCVRVGIILGHIIMQLCVPEDDKGEDGECQEDNGQDTSNITHYTQF